MRVSVFVLCFTALPAAAGAAEAQRDAVMLLQQSCDTCHASVHGGKAEAVYTRSTRRVTSPQVLVDQVRLWNSAAGAKWSEAEIQSVVKHLNDAYYKLQ